jgi:hypothetical protein
MDYLGMRSIREMTAPETHIYVSFFGHASPVFLPSFVSSLASPGRAALINAAAKLAKSTFSAYPSCNAIVQTMRASLQNRYKAKLEVM